MKTFEVWKGGTLAVAGFEEVKSRRECYYVHDRFATSADLVSAMDDCQPLAWEVERAYSDFLEDLSAQLETARTRMPMNVKQVARLEARLESLPEDETKGARDWLEAIPARLFKGTIVKRITKWFDDPPNWGEEEDYIDHFYTAQGAAMSFFEDMDQESLKLLGVKIVEGEHPGSTYFAAELRCSIEQANRAAKKADLPVRFVTHRSAN